MIRWAFAWMTLTVIGVAFAAEQHREKEKIGQLRLELETETGIGDGQFVVKLVSFREHADFGAAVFGSGGAPIHVPEDGKEHSIKVPASFPVATMVRIDSTPILVMFRTGDPVYFLRDTSVGWTVVSKRTDPRMGHAPLVVCTPVGTPCPDSFVEAGDPPLYHDRRCPTPNRVRSATEKLCYRPGMVSFRSGTNQTVELVDWTVGGPVVRRKLELEAGKASDMVPLEYERQRPQGVRIAGRDYFLAVGQGERWAVTIDALGKIEARAK